MTSVNLVSFKLNLYWQRPTVVRTKKSRVFLFIGDYTATDDRLSCSSICALKSTIFFKIYVFGEIFVSSIAKLLMS